MAIRDKDIREPLFDFLEAEYGKIRIIEEKTMGCSTSGGRRFSNDRSGAETVPVLM